MLIHGYCESGTVWNEIIDPLSDRCRIIVPDLPGFGKSPLHEDHLTLDEVARQIHQMMTELAIPKYLVMGHSLGGYLTLALERLFGDNITGFGLIHSTAFEDSTAKKAGRDQVIKIVSEKGSSLFLQNFYQNLFHQPKQEIIATLQKEGETIDGRSIIAYARAMRDRPDSTKLLISEKPKLIVAGTMDGAVPIEDSRKMSELANNALYIELSNTGHMGMYEEPELLLKGINSFLDQVL